MTMNFKTGWSEFRYEDCPQIRESQGVVLIPIDEPEFAAKTTPDLKNVVVVPGPVSPVTLISPFVKFFLMSCPFSNFSSKVNESKRTTSATDCLCQL